MVFHFPLDKLTQDVVVWHLFFLVPQWCFIFPFRGGAPGHRDSIQTFSNKWLGKLVGRVFMWAQALVTILNLVPFPPHDSLVHKCLFHSLILGCVEEYFKTTLALTPFSLAPTSFNTTLAFTALHLELDGYSLFFL